MNSLAFRVFIFDLGLLRLGNQIGLGHRHN